MRGPTQRRRSLVAAVVALAACGSVLVACTDDEPSAGQDPTERLVAIYAATITEVATDTGALPDADDEDAPQVMVFLQTHEDAQINADVQVGVVSGLEDWANVRFIDEVDEALSEDDEGTTVRDDGILIGLGPVSDGEVTADLVADRWVSDDETYVYDVAVRRQGGEWMVEQPLDGMRVRNP